MDYAFSRTRKPDGHPRPQPPVGHHVVAGQRIRLRPGARGCGRLGQRLRPDPPDPLRRSAGTADAPALRSAETDFGRSLYQRNGGGQPARRRTGQEAAKRRQPHRPGLCRCPQPHVSDRRAARTDGPQPDARPPRDDVRIRPFDGQLHRRTERLLETHPDTRRTAGRTHLGLGGTGTGEKRRAGTHLLGLRRRFRTGRRT